MLLLAPLLALVAAAWQSAAPSEPAAPAPGVEITYLANAGFFLRAGAQGVLIDACVREPVEAYAALPGPVHGQLTNARAPFDCAMLVLVSHAHPDHVQPRVLEKLLTNNARARLVTSPEVIAMLAGGALDFASIQDRVEPVETVRGTIATRELDGVRVQFLPLEHSGKGHGHLVNLGHLIELGGLRILHVGDAEPTPAQFTPYELGSKAIDVAIVPYWYFGSAGGAKTLHDEIRARTLIVSHVPPKEWDALDTLLKAQFPDVILFKNAMEKRTFLPAGAKPAPAAGVAPSGG